MFLQLLLNGIVLGSGYALISIGHTIIFGLMRVSNFAHGEFYMLGAYFAFTFLDLLGLPFALAFFLTIVCGIILGYLLNRLVFKYVRDDMTVNGLVTIGMSIFFTNLAQYIWGAQPKNLMSPFKSNTIFLGRVSVTPARLFIILASAVSLFAFFCIIKYTKLGKAFRATFQQRDAARLVGIDSERIYSVSTILGTVMACIAGALLGLAYSLEPTMGAKAISVSWAVVVAGGPGNFIGAITIGLLMGIIEALGGGYISSAYKDAFPFIILILVLIFKPQGIFSKGGSRMNG
ncbi:branched-chain amino acid ABC transporter permease [Oscillibacter sp. MSJ-31]|uniref:branched-chain amino acid ABC transporter permease n=1 Tax=Oscillibacter sp. MSJ-31 TaxID=2841526 RepID=UPI001C11266A|nr:branched-chain amino acid ABC transporter permease [Oscillibacter sp. MSJ-31]MBU5457366.1 branched-chain amino acid ABC transporter permease [Oscillibacter sp. MSJ-31]